MVWFRDHWYEEVLRQLRQGLTKCYVIAFDNRGAVNDATITPHTLNFVKKLGATFGIGRVYFWALPGSRDPHFDNVTRRHGYLRGPSGFFEWRRGAV